MALHGFKEMIEENDTVMLYINFSTIIPIKVSETTMNKKGDKEVENIYQTKYGALKVSDLIGKKFGHRVDLSKGFAYALHPSPELWTKSLPHRTQILYSTDIAMIILQLELKPGCVVIESGTGSGSLSHSLIRTIAPSGHLHTYDFHQQRSEKARVEFDEHGLKDFVTCYHKDVCEEGFGLENTADAVFLDLPHPWKVVPHAKKSLKRSGGRLCSFSPCIEQVQETCEQLKENGFKEVNTIECLLREFQVRKITLPEFDPEFDPLDEKNDNSDNLPSEQDNQQKEDGQKGMKRKHTGSSIMEAEKKFVTGVPLTSMPGHTGYLTFATLPPILS
eukprot:TRINITY_DN828_c0_g1_i3.p1 TRINITY_DN828_c0_g1~~TRINITY_DN828_c0_g1_i3.p1  ORF type:complete len:344 (-),score=68.28 TRINITY_DN828_c0_g1_i3:159-1157(-)